MRNTVLFRLLILWCGLALAFAGLALRYITASGETEAKAPPAVAGPSDSPRPY